MKIRIFSFLFLGITTTVGFPGTGSAQSPGDISQSVAYCLSKDTIDTRLGCFEQIGTALGIQYMPMASRAFTPALRTFSWAKEADWDDGKAYASMEAMDVVQDDALMSKSRASITLRCENQNIYLYLTFEKVVADNSRPVTVTVDGTEMKKIIRWEPSGSGKSLGLWRREEAIRVADRLMKGNLATLRVSIAAGKSITANFDVSEMRQEAAEVMSICNWPK